ncbi:hypothetical protein [Burkholderia gladioli]|uniref:hypothetical protein n=1 Tax=Burkholderia gladioli TaxID=28095 RepID=UPI001C5F5233|nr:hypothetical protein [Burkholderia gladioli]MBW5285940.1 hypothetical protein [Burkholderia gladioli]
MGDPLGGPAYGKREDVGSIIGGAVSAIGGIVGADASSDAAQTQADAANRAADLQWQQYQQTRSDLQPYRDLGTSYIPQLQTALTNPLLTATFTAPTAAEAAATPGYQFTLDQGLKAARNSASARGLGSSGAAIKGAESFASGLADATYGDTFNRALTTYATNQNTASNQVNRLLGLVGNGQNAAAMTGSLGAQAAGNVGNAITSGAAASAAGTVGSANALTNGLAAAYNNYTNSSLLNRLFPTTGGSPTLYGSGGYGSVNANNPSGYNIGSNTYGFTTG